MMSLIERLSLPAATRFWTGVLAGAAALALFVAAADPAQAQRGRGEEREADDESRSFSPDIGELVVRGQEFEDADNLGEAERVYNRALEMRGITPYEKGIILQLLGNIAYQSENIPQAITFFERAIAEGNFLPNEVANFKYNIGNLYLSEEQFAKAAALLEEWLTSGAEIKSDQIYMNLVYAYVELGQLRDALRHALSAYNFASPRERKHYDTLNYLYTELNMPRERAALLQEMVQIYPTDKSIWTSIAALYAQGGQESKAFEINKIMYLNGMFEEESEIMRVVDYYSYYEVPFRGAEILKREMNRGRVERSQKNLEKLARLYRQAREFNLAIEPLQAAAGQSGDGKLFRELGEALYAEGKGAEAERALLEALNRGVQRPGDLWVIIGNARYEREQRETAIAAFVEGEKFPYSRRTARGWREFIEAEIAAEENRIAFENEVAEEEIRLGCERRATTSIIDAPPVNDPRTGEPVDCAAYLAGSPT